MSNTTEILTLEQISNWLKNKRLYMISQQTGLSYPTLQRFRDDINHNFNIDTVKIISDHIRNDFIN